MRSVANVFLFLIFSALFAHSQSILPIGQWRDHLSSSSSVTSALVGSRIYSGTNSSFFYYDINTGETKTLSKLDGFSQSNVQYLAYSESAKTLVIAYENSQIDLLKDGVIYTVNDIYNTNVSSNISINHILIAQNQVWISTGFGLVVYDLIGRKVLASYQSFDNDVLVRNVYNSAILMDSIFVTTSTGLYVSSLASDVNKLDYSNWKKIPYPLTSDPLLSIYFLTQYKDKLYLSTPISNNQSNLDTLFVYSNGKWISEDPLSAVLASNSQDYYGFAVSDSKLWIFRPNAAFSYNDSVCKLEFGYVNKLFLPRNIIVDQNGSIWISDQNSGLNKAQYGSNQRVAFGPSGPSFTSPFRFGHSSIFAVSGGYDGNYTASLNQEGFSFYNGVEWKNYSSLFGNMPAISDLTSANYNKFNGKYYFTSWTSGILEWDGAQKFTIYNQDTPGSLLQTCTDPSFCNVPNALFCRVADIDIDSKGDMWMLNPSPKATSHKTLFKYGINGQWQSFDWRGTGPLDNFNYYSVDDDNSPNYYTTKIHIDKNDNKWIACRPGAKMGGLMVFNETRYNLPRYLSYTKDVKEEICGSTVRCITSDVDGAVWIGTDNGVCYFADPNVVFQRTSIKAAVPVFENRALLKGINVTAIDIDGSNRKWIGTDVGAWLFSSDGSKLIVQFDANNSPLPSSKIIDIKVDQKSGEVFVATDRGMMSYGGNSILGEDQNTTVVVYPNPLKSDFDGYMAISGLTNNATVKITDISGKLVYQTKAEGSLASWNIKDYNGRRPQPGIYLIFTSKDDGSEALVNKIAILD